MIVKYLSKFVLEVLPSVVATIIGAYIVNHYIAARPAADAPVAASVSTVDPKKADTRNAEKSAETPSELASLPESGQAQKATADKTAAERPRTPRVCRRKPAGVSRRPARRPRQEDPVSAAATASVIVPVEVNPAPAQEDRRDANDMARAAIERLRGSSPAETSRTADAPRAADTPRVASVPPLPPAIAVPTPSGDGFIPPPRSPYCPWCVSRTRCGRPRPLIFRWFHDRWICMPRPPARRWDAPRLPMTCCRRRSRYSTRCCRNRS